MLSNPFSHLGSIRFAELCFTPTKLDRLQLAVMLSKLWLVEPRGRDRGGWRQRLEQGMAMDGEDPGISKVAAGHL